MAGVITPDLRVPDFDLPASTGETISLESYRGKVSLVLLFTPDLKASLRILRRFNERLADFDAATSQVLAVAAVVAGELREFADENDLALPLLSDVRGSITQELNLEHACHPVVIVVDQDGRIRESITYPDAHVEGILDHIRRLRGEPDLETGAALV
jgi:peroxiredoxin